MNTEMNEIEIEIAMDLIEIHAEFTRECEELDALDAQDAGYID